MEPSGYSLSGETDAPSSITNMNKELHQCLQALGIDRYVLLPEHEKLSNAVKKGKTMVLKGGHYIHYQNEEQIAGIVKQFFGGMNEASRQSLRC